MADLTNQKNLTDNNLVGKKRWQIIKELPPDTVLKVLGSYDANGQPEKYQVKDLEPIFDDKYQSKVTCFGVKSSRNEYGFQTLVCEAHLRLMHDSFKCSLIAGGRN